MNQTSLFPTLEVREPGSPVVQPVSYTRPRLVSRALKLLEGELRQGDALASPDAVRDYLRLLLGDRPPAQVVQQCGSGVTACHNLLAMEIAGLPGSRLYAGSWSEWCSDPSRPVAV